MNYLDFHADTLTETDIKTETLYKNSRDIDLERTESFTDRYVQVFALWKDMKRTDAGAQFLQTYQNARKLLEQEKDRVRFCQSAKDLEAAEAEGKAAAFLAVEDLSFMGEHVFSCKELGISIVMPVWNYVNEYGAGAAADQSMGLTELGKETLTELIGQGVIPDVSHLSDAGIEDLLKLTEKAVIASHSDVREICNMPRNLKKEYIQEIIRRHGIIGINLFAPFVKESGEAELTDLFRHMDYILELGGENALAFGCDFDGCDGKFPKDINGVESMPFLKVQMEQAGFGRELTEGIFYKNGHDFLMRNL